MTDRSKRYSQAKKLVDSTKTYDIDEALQLVKKISTTKFDGSVEVHIKLGIDPKKGDQSVRGSVTLPHGTGKKKIIAVFAEGKAADDARAAGADIVGGDELIQEIKKTGKVNFEIGMATPAMMKKLGPVAKILGPKGLMPNPKNETITDDVAKTVAALSSGKITFRNDESGNIHQVIGKTSFETKQLGENLSTFLEAVKRTKPQALKGTFLLGMAVASTMSPAIKIKS